MSDSSLGIDQRWDHCRCDVLQVELVAGEGEQAEHDHVQDGLPHQGLLVAQVVEQLGDHLVRLDRQHQLLEHSIVLDPHDHLVVRGMLEQGTHHRTEIRFDFRLQPIDEHSIDFEDQKVHLEVLFVQ